MGEDEIEFTVMDTDFGEQDFIGRATLKQTDYTTVGQWLEGFNAFCPDRQGVNPDEDPADEVAERAIVDKRTKFFMNVFRQSVVASSVLKQTKSEQAGQSKRRSSLANVAPIGSKRMSQDYSKSCSKRLSKQLSKRGSIGSVDGKDSKSKLEQHSDEELLSMPIEPLNSWSVLNHCQLQLWAPDGKTRMGTLEVSINAIQGPLCVQINNATGLYMNSWEGKRDPRIKFECGRHVHTSPATVNRGLFDDPYFSWSRYQYVFPYTSNDDIVVAKPHEDPDEVYAKKRVSPYEGPDSQPQFIKFQVQDSDSGGSDFIGEAYCSVGSLLKNTLRPKSRTAPDEVTSSNRNSKARSSIVSSGVVVGSSVSVGNQTSKRRASSKIPEASATKESLSQISHTGKISTLDDEAGADIENDNPHNECVTTLQLKCNSDEQRLPCDSGLLDVIVRPQKVVYIDVISARELYSLSYWRSVDPYAKVMVGQQHATSPCMSKTKNPTWDWRHSFIYQEWQDIFFSVFDRDLLPGTQCLLEESISL